MSATIKLRRSNFTYVISGRRELRNLFIGQWSNRSRAHPLHPCHFSSLPITIRTNVMNVYVLHSINKVIPCKSPLYCPSAGAGGFASRSTTAEWPFFWAMIFAVVPKLSWRAGSAPLSSNRRTIFTLPDAAAIIKAVIPFFLLCTLTSAPFLQGTLLSHKRNVWTCKTARSGHHCLWH